MAEFIEVIKQKERICESVSRQCEECELSMRHNIYRMKCGDLIFNNPQEAEEIIMKWAKEHPVMTNADKFKEVFGTEPNITTVCPVKSMQCFGISCLNCDKNNFWKQEYKAPEE